MDPLRNVGWKGPGFIIQFLSIETNLKYQTYFGFE